MSEENLDALKAVYERWAVGDWSDNSKFDPHAVGVLFDPTPEAHYGLNALADYMQRFLESWDNLRMEGTDYREAGDSVVVRTHMVATGRGSGLEVDHYVFHVWTFRGRSAIRLESFERESEALEAAGLSE
jgi:ketosteroid isomerase-like protein